MSARNPVDQFARTLVWRFILVCLMSYVFGIAAQQWHDGYPLNWVDYLTLVGNVPVIIWLIFITYRQYRKTFTWQQWPKPPGSQAFLEQVREGLEDSKEDPRA